MIKKIAILFLALMGCIHRQKTPVSEPTLIAVGSWHGQEVLTYCVDESFGAYLQEIKDMSAKTAQDWTDYGRLSLQQLPECNGWQNITIMKTTEEAFPRAAAQIPSRANDYVFMIVKLVEGPGQILDGGKIRRERLYGVLLHEWGHILGFDHEHNGPLDKLITAQDFRSIMYYPWEPGRWHRTGWDDGWDRARMSILDKLGMMTRYPPKRLARPTNATPQVVSEEQGEANCPAGAILIGIACYGKYCDDKRLFCAEPVGVGGKFDVSLSTPISDKNPSSGIKDKMFISGMECRGNYCGEMRLKYASSPELKVNAEACYQSGPISSDPGPYGQSYYHICRKNHAVTGLMCSGAYCGSLSVRCCPIR